MVNVFTSHESVFFSAKPINGTYEIAVWWRRLSTFLIDFIGVYVFAFCFGILLALVGLERLLLSANEFVVGWVLYVTYYFPQEALWGRTFGKLIMKTKVLRKDGDELQVSDAVARTIYRFIPFEALSFLSRNGRPIGWHDKLAHTIVVTRRD